MEEWEQRSEENALFNQNTKTCEELLGKMENKTNNQKININTLKI